MIRQLFFIILSVILFAETDAQTNDFYKMIRIVTNDCCKKIVLDREKNGLPVPDRFYICIDGIPGLESDYDEGYIYGEMAYRIVTFSMYNSDGWPKWFKREVKKGLPYEAFNYILSGNQITIVVRHESMHYEKGQVVCALGCWSHYIFEYDCAKNNWDLTDIKFFCI